MTQDEKEILNRWMSRALRAEVMCFEAGLKCNDPRDAWSDDRWMVITLTKKDGSPLHIDELNEARSRLGESTSAPLI